MLVEISGGDDRATVGFRVWIYYNWAMQTNEDYCTGQLVMKTLQMHTVYLRVLAESWPRCTDIARHHGTNRGHNVV